MEGRPPLHSSHTAAQQRLRNRAVRHVLRAREEEATSWCIDSASTDAAPRSSPLSPLPALTRALPPPVRSRSVPSSARSIAMPGLVEVVWRRVAFFLGRKSPKAIGRLVSASRLFATPTTGLWRIYCVDRWPALRVYQLQSLDGYDGTILRSDLFGAIARRRSRRPALLAPSDAFTDDAKLLIDVTDLTGEMEGRGDARVRAVLSRVEAFRYQTFAGVVAAFGRPIPLCDVTVGVVAALRERRGARAAPLARAAQGREEAQWEEHERGLFEALDGRDFDAIYDASRLHLRVDLLRESNGMSACVVSASGSSFVDGVLVGALSAPGRGGPARGGGGGSSSSSSSSSDALATRRSGTAETPAFGLRFSTPIVAGWTSFPVALVAEAVLIVRCVWEGGGSDVGCATLEALEMRVTITAEGEDMPRYSMLNVLEHLLHWA